MGAFLIDLVQTTPVSVSLKMVGISPKKAISTLHNQGNSDKT
jgi:hypothetical protein